jgi:HlyD family secretion protein
MKSSSRKWVVAVLLLTSGGAAAMYLQQRNTETPPTYTTLPVRRGRLVARVSATGTVSALVTVQVGSQVSGRIQEILVDFNSPVEKGQVIARIDPQLFEAARAQARANALAAAAGVARAKARELEAHQQLARTKRLVEQRLAPEAELDSSVATANAAKADVAAEEAAVAQASAALHQAEVNLRFTTIVSPIKGVVISRSVDVGQTVAASFQSPTLFTIAEDLRHMQVDTNVSEADVGKLRPGMEATFTVDAYPGEPFRGKVRQIRSAPQTLQNVVTYDAVIDVENPELRLRPGMTANVNFSYANVANALQLPNAALRFRPPLDWLDPEGKPDGARRHRRSGQEADEGAPAPDPLRRTVWVRRGTASAPTHEQVVIRTGITNGAQTEVAAVLEGALAAGDEAITEIAGGALASSKPAGGPPVGMRRGL